MTDNIVDLENLTDEQVERLSEENFARWLEAEYIRDVQRATVSQLWDMADYSLEFIEGVSADDAPAHPSDFLIAHTESKHAQIVLAELRKRIQQPTDINRQTNRRDC